MAYFPCFAVVGEDELGPEVGRVERVGRVEVLFSTCSITILNIQIITFSLFFLKENQRYQFGVVLTWSWADGEVSFAFV